METQRSRREELLHTAFERGLISAEQLDEFLSLEAGDERLADLVAGGWLTREQVESLALMRYMDAPREPPPPPQSGFWDRIEGKRFSRYLLQAKIGEGATALVLKAFDEKLNRVVALKVLKESAASVPSWVERFMREARAMARLRHPNITAVHDTGTEQGWHYFSMDYIAERPLREIMLDPTVKLKQVLEILEKVARACHFAHEQGVVHRDLKPGNILVDEKFEPFVTDFGIARLTLEKDDRLTQTGTILGTAHYMSPEHVAGDPDLIERRSDVFSLGAIGYEAATGRPPFTGRGIMAVMTAIATTDPVRPRALVPSIPPDVEAVLMKALEKAPSQRYQTASDLADDLARLRQGQPVSAARISTIAMVLRRVRKNRWAAMALVLAVILLGGVVFQTALRARHEADGDREPDLEKKLGLYERAGAESKAAEVRRTLQQLREQKAALERQLALRESLEPPLSRARAQIEEARRLRGADGKLRARELARAASESLAPILEQDPTYAEAWTAVAKARELMSDEAGALTALDRAVQETGGSVLARIERAKLLLSRYARLRGLPPAYFHLARKMVMAPPREENQAETVVRERVEEDLRRLRDAGPEVYLKVEALLEGALDVCRGHYARGCERLTEAIRLDRFEILGWIHRGRGLYLQGRFAEAELDWNEVVARPLAGATAWMFRGVTRHAQGNFKGAIEDCTVALELDPELEGAWASRGNARYSTGNIRAALDDYYRALQLNPRSVSSLSNRGSCHQLLREYDSAMRDLNAALELDPRFALAYSNRANTKYAMGDYQGSLDDNTRALDLDPKLATAYNNRANARFALNDLQGALEDYGRAIELEPASGLSYSNRANVLHRAGDRDGAMKDYEKAMEVEPMLGIPYYHRGLRHQEEGDLAAARADFDRAIELDPASSDFLNQRGILRHDSGDYEGAIEDYNRALVADPGNANACNNRGNSWFALNDYEAAIRDLDRALELNPKFGPGYYNRANVLMRLADREPSRRRELTEAALKDYRISLEKTPADWQFRPRAQAALAEAQRRLGIQEY